MTAKDIITALGTDAVASRLGVSRKTVTEAARLGSFPAAWWLEMLMLGNRAGVEVPSHLFSFKSAATDEAAA